MLTQSRLKTLLNYDPETGVFTRTVRTSPRINAGDVAGTDNGDGYRQISVDGRLYKTHRLAWLYMHGVWPKDQIDHVNGIRDDNRIANLREASNAENAQNRVANRGNPTGLIGVSWHKTSQKWRAQIRIEQKTKHLGLFDTPESAHAAYLAAKAELHTFNQTVRA